MTQNLALSGGGEAVATAVPACGASRRRARISTPRRKTRGPDGPARGNEGVGPAAEGALAARAAWLYHAGGATQAEVAARLGTEPAKAHRPIARAARDGLVRVYVAGPLAGRLDLERRLSEESGLSLARVVPDLGEARAQPPRRPAPAQPVLRRAAAWR